MGLSLSSEWAARPLVIAHRGASAYAPENSLVACGLAIDMGADVVEVDVQLSADRKVICFHDARLDRLTSASGQVSKMTFKELRQLRLGGETSEERIPLLEEVIEICRGKVRLLIEIKSRGGSPVELVRQVAEVLRRSGAESFSVLASFDRIALEHAASLVPKVPLALIINRFHSPGVIAEPWPLLAVHEAIVDRNLVDTVHQAGKRIFVWTVDDESRMATFVRLGVDGVVTNRPDRLLDLLTRLEKHKPQLGANASGGE